MKVILSSDQLSYFEKHGHIELEGFFAQNECELFQKAIQKEIHKRGGSFSSPHDVFVFGRNLSLSSQALKKHLFSLKLASCANDLSMKKPLRYGFDQLFLPSNEFPGYCEEDTRSIEEVSSVKGLVFAALISPFSKNGDSLGSVTFFSPEKPWPLGLRSKDEVKLLFVFAHQNPQYRHEPLDIHTHLLKREGYVFGDILKETTHPILFR